MKGVDGIKTGYTRASGFNLVSSVQDGNRRLVAVVMGGASGASRDNQMADLIKTYLPKASRGGGGGDLIAKTDTPMPQVAAAKVELPKHDAPTPDIRPQADMVQVAEATIEDVVASDATAVASDAAAAAAPVPARKPTIDASSQPKIAMASAERFGGPLPFKVRNPKEAVPAAAAEGVEQAYAEPAQAPAVDPVNTASVPDRLGHSGRLVAERQSRPAPSSTRPPSRQPPSSPTPRASPCRSRRAA